MERGEIWWASLPEPVGSEPGYRRPMVIVQADRFNRSGIQTVVAALLTTNLRLADAPGNVLLRKAKSGLPKDCIVNVSQILTVDKRFLTECVGTLPASLMDRIDAGLRLVLDL